MTRTTWSLVAILLILGTLVYFLMQRPGEQSSSTAGNELLASFDSAAVTRIDVNTSGSQITIMKSSDGWMMTSPLSYRADGSVAQSVISQLHSMKVSAPISTNPAKFAMFHVDSSATRVALSTGSMEVVALRVGKPNESFTDTYVRKEPSSEVRLASGFFGLMVGRGPTDWRDKTIFGGDRGGMKSVQFVYGDTAFTLSHGDSGWAIDGQRPNEATLKTWLNSFASFQADGFVDTTLPSVPAPKAIIVVDGTQIQFCPSPKAGTMLVRSSDKLQWFEVHDWRSSALLKRKTDFLTH